MTITQRPLVSISMGDPGGIGAEITVKTLALQEVYDVCRPLVVGDAGVIQEAVTFCKLPLTVQRLNDPCEMPDEVQPGIVYVIDLANLPLSELRYKTVTPAQGKASFEYIAANIRLALEGKVDATVTGPINKAALNAGGYHYAGHTEIYADLTRTKDYAMMLADSNFRVAHVSTHVSLAEACNRVKKERVSRVISLTHDVLLKMGIANPRIAVAGLNPHCGEGGLFGTEDDIENRPAVEEAVTKGMLVEGPIPADTVFSKMAGGMYDAVVVMYHDQGHIPTKLQGFKYNESTGVWGSMSGVNLTLGLPIIRVSVDHGTAFGKAGEGRANPQSMMDSVLLAARLANVAQA